MKTVFADTGYWEAVLNPKDKLNANVEVLPQTSIQFREAYGLYKRMADKEWSLTDCASFEIMKARGITEALAHDHHFEQAGFTALLRP